MRRPQQSRGLEDDAELLRPPGGDWEPQAILERFGCAIRDQDHLPRLLTACAVIYGPSRMGFIAGRLEQAMLRFAPPLRAMVHDDALIARRELLEALGKRLPEARNELRAVRYRSDNDVANMYAGLRGTELAYLTLGIRTAILATEVISRRSRVGLERALHLVMRRPSLDYAEEWQERLFDTDVLEGIQLFEPADFGRVIVVYDDGRLAYDPAAPDEEPEDALL